MIDRNTARISLSSALGKQERKPFILELTCGQRNKAKCVQRLYPRASASMWAKSAFNFLFKLLPPMVCLENLRFLGEKSSFPDGALCHFTEILKSCYSIFYCVLQYFCNLFIDLYLQTPCGFGFIDENIYTLNNKHNNRHILLLLFLGFTTVYVDKR